MKVADMRVGMHVAYAPYEYSVQYQDLNRGVITKIVTGKGHRAYHSIIQTDLDGNPLDPQKEIQVKSRQIIRTWGQHKPILEERRRQQREKEAEAARIKSIQDLAHEQADELVSLLKIAGVNAEIKVNSNWQLYSLPPVYIMTTDMFGLRDFLDRHFHRIPDSSGSSEAAGPPSQPDEPGTE